MKFRKTTMGRKRVMAETDVAAEAVELLFEAEDVAQLVADVTGEDVEVTADGETVEFAVGDDTYVVEAEGTEEMLEASVSLKARNKVAASRSTKPAGRTVRKIRK